MTPALTPVLLAIALIVGGVGLAIGLPSWRSWQSRAAADRNAERYLAWRGRADRPATGQEMTTPERRRIAVGAGLGIVALVCLVIGLWSS